MVFDISHIDKSQFQCFKLNDESIYYGEVLKVSDEASPQFQSSSDLHNEEQIDQKFKTFRHGFGIQLFGVDGDQYTAKYEGYWDHDVMHGECFIEFPDKSTFQGTLNQAVREGYGKFVWTNGDVYEGNWKNNVFENGGTFKNHDGNEWKGIYKNNYFVNSNNQFINPFLSGEEIGTLLNRKHEIALLKEKNKKIKFFFCKKTGDIEELSELIRLSNGNGRIPLIISSKQCNLRLHEVFQTLTEHEQRKYYDFDLRQAYLLKKQNQLQKYMKKIKQDLSNVLVKGDLFIINLDDSPVSYDEIFYPDIKEFYDQNCFPKQIWNVHEMKNYTVYQKVITETDNQLKTDISMDFNIVVWSKHKLDQELDVKSITDLLQQKFSDLPFIKIDIILFEQVLQAQPEQEEQVEQQQ